MPRAMRSSTWRKMASRLWGSGRRLFSLSRRGASQTRRLPACLNSGLMTFLALPQLTAKETRVGGTSRSSKLPDMESLPPMAATPRSVWAFRAPSRAARGLPQRTGSLPSRSKYSWKVR